MICLSKQIAASSRMNYHAEILDFKIPIDFHRKANKLDIFFTVSAFVE